jgi:hypothetical protein
VVRTSNIPARELDSVVRDSLDVKADGGDGCHDLTQLHLVPVVQCRGERAERALSSADHQPPVISLECQRGHEIACESTPQSQTAGASVGMQKGNFVCGSHSIVVLPAASSPRTSILACLRRPNSPTNPSRRLSVAHHRKRRSSHPTIPLHLSPPSPAVAPFAPVCMTVYSASSCPALVMRALDGVFMCVHVWWMRHLACVLMATCIANVSVSARQNGRVLELFRRVHKLRNLQPKPANS